MVHHFELVFERLSVLQSLDGIIFELYDSATLDADQVVVVTMTYRFFVELPTLSKVLLL